MVALPAAETAIRGALQRLLRTFDGGTITLVDGKGQHRLGAGGDLQAVVTVRSPAAYRSLLGGGRGLARAYADSLWDCDDLVAFVRIAARAMFRVDPLRERFAAITQPLDRVVAARRANTRQRSRSNVERHYDLGNDFFSLVLDETMGYSCAYYERPDMLPVEASRANLERVCHMLDLRPRDRLLEMGSGWGGLALHAATRFGCHVSTVTISHSQRDYIERLARDAGVADRVEVVMSDYRDVRGRWDKLVSLEMVESIGAQHLDTFLAQCGRLLAPDGLMVMQAITTTDRIFHVERYRRAFLNTLIFPNGCVPSLEAITRAAAQHTSMRVTAVYDITPHYPPTLRAWRDRLQRNWPRIEQLGRFDEHFRRLWTLYFSWCEAGFIERRVFDRQIVFANRGWREENRLLGLPL